MAPRPGATQPDRMSGINGKLGMIKKPASKQQSQKKADMAKKIDSIKNADMKKKATAAKKINAIGSKPMAKKPTERMSGAKMKKY